VDIREDGENQVAGQENKLTGILSTVVGERRKIIDTIVNRKKNWIGLDILRGDRLLKDVIEGRMEGKRTRGRRRRIGRPMIDELMECTYGQIKRRGAEDRVGWRSWTPRTCLTAEHS